MGIEVSLNPTITVFCGTMEAGTRLAVNYTEVFS